MRKTKEEIYEKDYKIRGHKEENLITKTISENEKKLLGNWKIHCENIHFLEERF